MTVGSLNSRYKLHLLLGGLWLANISWAQSSELLIRQYDHPKAQIITVTVPNQLLVSVVQAPRLQTVPQFASLNTLAVLNAGFFDPMNTLSTSWIISQQATIGNPTKNPSLMENPRLKTYLPAIIEQRPELRAYQCKDKLTYAIEPHHAPAACTIRWAVGAGPRLLPVYAPQSEAFIDTDPSTGKRTRDPIGVDLPNARSAVAVLPDNRLMLVYVGQTAEGKKGLTLPQLALWLKQQGVTQAMALDGGSSTSLWLKDKSYWGKGSWQNNGWHVIRRPIKSALVVSSTDATAQTTDVKKCN